jgi:adenylate kinase family enzyme
LDDNQTVITERLKEYDRLTQPLIDWFTSSGILVQDVNAERSVEEVNDDLEKYLNLK